MASSSPPPPAEPSTTPARADTDEWPVRFCKPQQMVVQVPQRASSIQRTKRLAELAYNRVLYQYEAPPTIPGVSFVKGPYSALPGQTPTRAYSIRMGLQAARVLVNSVCVSGRGRVLATLYAAIATLVTAVSVDADDDCAVADAIAQFSDRVRDASDAAARAVCERKLISLMRAARFSSDFEERNPTLQPYRRLYSAILRRPPLANVFMEDRVFARLRVAGFNPMSLFRVTSVPALPFWVPDDALRNIYEWTADSAAAATDSVASAAAEGRLYAVDLSFVSAVKPQRNSSKIYVPTKAVFALPRSYARSSSASRTRSASGASTLAASLSAASVVASGAQLQPVAVELNGVVVYPHEDGGGANARWEIAKLALNTCDAAHHELIAHLGRTHLLIEPFIAATMRQLAVQHPVRVLLTPHFEGTIFINETASQNLVTPGGDVDRIFAGDIASVMAYCAGQVRVTKFNACFPDKDLTSRGLLHAPLTFPYRDDAMAHFNALMDWVGAYIRHYYDSDAEVRDDYELQAWAAELTDHNMGQVRDFGDDGSGKLRTRSYLTRAIAFVIFTASVQHAAVNFPQSSLMSYAPAVSGALWAPPPPPSPSPPPPYSKTFSTTTTTTTTTTNMKAASLTQPRRRVAAAESRALDGAEHANADEGNAYTADLWRRMLTPVETASQQITILNTIGAVYHTRLGHYDRYQFCDAQHRRRWPQPIRDAHTRYLKALREIDRVIARRERGAELKYDYLRPANIPQSINV